MSKLAQQEANAILRTADDFIEGRIDQDAAHDGLRSQFQDVIKNGSLPQVLNRFYNQDFIPNGMPYVEFVGATSGPLTASNHITFRAGMFQPQGDSNRRLIVELPKSPEQDLVIKTATREGEMPRSPAQRAEDHAAGERYLRDYRRETETLDKTKPAGEEVVIRSHPTVNMKEFEFYHKDSLKNVKRLDMSNSRMESAMALESISKWTGLKEVNLSGCFADDLALQFLAQNKSIEKLNLRFGSFTDKGLQELVKLPLKSLDVSIGPDISFDILAKMSKLEEVKLGAFTDDADIAKLVGHKNLRDIDLQVNRAITAASFQSFEQMPALRHLDLRGASQLSKADIADLRRRMPNCKIDF